MLMPRAPLALSAQERRALERLCHTAAKPYLRERAAAILKVAGGQSLTQGARAGLLQPRKVETIGRWLARYRADGIDGLRIRAGRGRKPAFSPAAVRGSARPAARPHPAGAPAVRE